MMDLSKSIEQLESAVWEYNPYPSNVVQREQRLRKLALESLSIDDLRFLIGQEIGLPYVLPLAFEHLAENPAAGGQMYPGDLLDSVLSVRAAFWEEQADLDRELIDLIPSVESLLELLRDEILPALRERAS
ncbi:contact-dependent growth inhibition system immunity protein [Chitinimonas prasina]|nr:contact-dependent growth inhibition system immunity protein [Chitinimonas prasina]